MPSRYVVDASAWAKLFLDESHSEAFQSWRSKRVLAGDLLMAPTMFPYEIGQILRREFGAAEREPTLLQALLHVELEVPHWGSVFTHADKLSFYDAAYLSLATATAGTLVSYDDKLLKAAKAISCQTLSPGA